jgi:hypothetical protein
MGLGNLSQTSLLPVRIPALYQMLAVLAVISVVPLYFYSSVVVGTNRDRLKTNEMVLENTIARTLADDIAQRQSNLRALLANLASAIQTLGMVQIRAEISPIKSIQLIKPINGQ